jgi:uncharacterized surface protein with fasciclin (FAS1) repeats
MLRLSFPTAGLALGAVLLLTACGETEETTTTPEVGERPAAEETIATPETEQSLLDLIESEPRFSVLYNVLQAADLLETFENEGPLTIFAPSNEAFAKLPEGYSVEVLSAPENQDLLRQILAYHVVSGDITAAQISGRTGEADTLNGAKLAYDGSGAVVVVGREPGSAVVTIADLEAENGVIHVIDAVLLPPA